MDYKKLALLILILEVIMQCSIKEYCFSTKKYISDNFDITTPEIQRIFKVRFYYDKQSENFTTLSFNN